MSGAPIWPESMTPFRARYAASYRRMKPTWTKRRPAPTSASMMRWQACVVVASGFSQKTGLPAAIDARTNSSWVGPQEQTITASTTSSPIRSSPVACTTAAGSVAATSFAAASRVSVTATTSAPDSTWVSRRMWSRPIIPVPMTPTLSVIGLVLSRGRGSVGPPAHRAETAADVVARRAGAYGERDVRLDGVEVLLDHRKDLAVQLAERVEERGHVRLAVGRLAHDAQLDRLGERHPLRERSSADGRVHRLEVHVGDPLGEPLDDLNVVAAAVGDVPGVQAEVDKLRFGVAEELLDPILGVDVGVRMRVEDELDAVLLVDDPGQLVRAGDQVLPLLEVEVSGVRRLARVLVGVLLGEMHQVLRADRCQELRLAAEVSDRLVERVPALVQAGEHGAAADPETPLSELVLQPTGVLWHETLGSQLGVDVAHCGDLVQVHLPRDLVGVLGKPHPPRVRCDAEAELGQIGHGVALWWLLGGGKVEAGVARVFDVRPPGGDDLRSRVERDAL